MILFSLFFLIFYGNFWGKPRVAGLGCHWTSQGGTIQPHWIDDSLSCGLMGWTGLKNSNKLKLLLFLLVKINLFFFDDWTRSIVWKTKNEVEEAENSVANALAEHLEAELKDQLTAGKHGTVWYLVRYLVNFWCLWNARLELEYCWGFDPWIHLPSSLSWVFKDCLVMWGNVSLFEDGKWANISSSHQVSSKSAQYSMNNISWTCSMISDQCSEFC
jgi:hypothetical protein